MKKRYMRLFVIISPKSKYYGIVLNDIGTNPNDKGTTPNDKDKKLNDIILLQ